MRLYRQGERSGHPGRRGAIAGLWGGRTALALWASIAIGASCGDGDGPSTPPGPPPALPVIQVTAGFGDSPLVGELILEPVPNEAPWAFEVDLDGDGIVEFASVLLEEVVLPYRFEEVGVHLIRVRLTHEQTESTVDELVVVNDPSALRAEQAVLDPSLSAPLIEGIAVSRDGRFVYASKANRETILRLRASDLVVEDSIDIGDLEETGVLEGLAISPDDRRLLVVNKFSSLTVLATPDLTVIHHFPDVAESYFVVAESDDRAVVSGVTGRLARIDVETGEVLTEAHMDAYHFAPAPDRQTIAVSVESSETGNGVRLIAAGDFGQIWFTALHEYSPWAIAFNPGGDRLYLFASKTGVMWLVVLEVDSGEILREFRIEPEVSSTIAPGVANPAAVSADGRFVVFPSPGGAYFVDTTLDLPVFRLPGLDGCCNVAASETENVFFIASGASIVKVRPS